MMTERPILFSAAMVRALLAGTKTQTRRALRGFCPPSRPEYDSETGRAEWFNGDEVVVGIRCPYGRPGDRLWVREAWRTSPMFDDKPPRDLPDFAPLRYEADEALRGGWAGYGYGEHAKYRPPMFMPRWASRITLEVTEVRVERLQAISQADALAEGIVETCGGYGLPAGEHFHAADPRQSYFSLWEAINGPGSVEANPWLWCVSFRRVEVCHG